ncbi:uncharacterized protein LOC135700392 [Ochlerotatus camptorhynchus]|uniref:uncharacterized protein LOC135700392 n=1 Tax=Ochlerotatus camptorhynchus TaxID=644619 RepID=UPI0031E1FFF3
MTAFGRVSALESNMFRTAILESMQHREKALFGNYAFQTAVFMDPRFSFHGSNLFSSSQKERIVLCDYLLAVYNKLTNKSQTSHQDPSPLPANEGVPSTSQGKFSLNCYLSSRLGESSATIPKSNTLEIRLRNLQYQQRVDADIQDFSIVHYWAQKRFEDSEMWKLARVVFGAAATQCTVERDFSQFNIVLTKPRNRLKDQNLENVLKIRANKGMIQEALCAALQE